MEEAEEKGSGTVRARDRAEGERKRERKKELCTLHRAIRRCDMEGKCTERWWGGMPGYRERRRARRGLTVAVAAARRQPPLCLEPRPVHCPSLKGVRCRLPSFTVPQILPPSRPSSTAAAVAVAARERSVEARLVSSRLVCSALIVVVVRFGSDTIF